MIILRYYLAGIVFYAIGDSLGNAEAIRLYDSFIRISKSYLPSTGGITISEVFLERKVCVFISWELVGLLGL